MLSHTKNKNPTSVGIHAPTNPQTHFQRVWAQEPTRPLVYRLRWIRKQSQPDLPCPYCSEQKFSLIYNACSISPKLYVSEKVVIFYKCFHWSPDDSFDSHPASDPLNDFSWGSPPSCRWISLGRRRWTSEMYLISYTDLFTHWHNSV